MFPIIFRFVKLLLAKLHCKDVLEHAFRAADGHGTGNGIISLYEFESFLFNVGLGGAPADGVPFSRRTVQNMKRFVGAVFSDSVVPQLLTRQDKYQAPGAAVAKVKHPKRNHVSVVENI